MSENSNSILFLYEGDTENEFYTIIFRDHITERKIRISKSNLSGLNNINKKVKRKLHGYLAEKKTRKKIHVIVAYDREGPRHLPTRFNISLLRKEFVSPSSRIITINEIVATQDLESWLFHDIDGIYTHLRTKNTKRNPSKYRNVEKFNNSHLSQLFHQVNKHYQKGKRVEGFLTSLDFEKIIAKTEPLQSLISIIKELNR